MIPMRSVSAAALVAALVSFTGVPAFAATSDTAKVVMATKTDIVPVGNLVDMIGEWTPGDLTFLDKAASVKTIDTKELYPAADQTQIASAESAKATQLGKLRDAIKADSALNAWFTDNKIDISRVVAVADPHGNPELYLY